MRSLDAFGGRSEDCSSGRVFRTRDGDYVLVQPAGRLTLLIPEAIYCEDPPRYYTRDGDPQRYELYPLGDPAVLDRLDNRTAAWVRLRELGPGRWVITGVLGLGGLLYLIAWAAVRPFGVLGWVLLALLVAAVGTLLFRLFRSRRTVVRITSWAAIPEDALGEPSPQVPDTGESLRQLARQEAEAAGQRPGSTEDLIAVRSAPLRTDVPTGRPKRWWWRPFTSEWDYLVITEENTGEFRRDDLPEVLHQVALLNGDDPLWQIPVAVRPRQEGRLRVRGPLFEGSRVSLQIDGHRYPSLEMTSDARAYGRDFLRRQLLLRRWQRLHR